MCIRDSSEEICYTSSATFSDEELMNMIRYAKSKGIRVALKPTVNCKKMCIRDSCRAVMLQLALQNIMENMKSLCWIKKKMVYWI